MLFRQKCTRRKGTRRNVTRRKCTRRNVTEPKIRHEIQEFQHFPMYFGMEVIEYTLHCQPNGNPSGPFLFYDFFIYRNKVFCSILKNQCTLLVQVGLRQMLEV